MYKVAVYNEYHIRSLLAGDDIDFNKFYKDQLIEFLEVSKKDTKKYKKLYELELAKNSKAIKKCDELAECIEELEGSYSYLFVEIENILKGSDKSD